MMLWTARPVRACKAGGNMKKSAQPKQKRQSAGRIDAGERILKSAANIFASRGFVGASIREIALDADVTHQLITYYYGGKEDLWWAVVETEIDRLLITYGETNVKTKNVTPEQRFRQFVHGFVAYEANHGALARLMLQEALAKSARYQKLLNHKKLTGADPVTRFLDEAYEQGILIDMPAPELKLNFLSLITHRYMIDLYASLTLGEPVRSSAAIKKHADAIASMFLRSSRS